MTAERGASGGERQRLWPGERKHWEGGLLGNLGDALDAGSQRPGESLKEFLFFHLRKGGLGLQNSWEGDEASIMLQDSVPESSQ